MGNGSAPLWQWPLQSLRRLLATVAALICLIVVLALVFNSTGQQGSSDRVAPAASPSPSAAGTPAPAPSPSVPAVKDYGLAIDIARAFVQAWADHKPDSEKAWYAGAARFASDQFAAELTSVDYRNVPANMITGTLRLTDTGGVGQTEVAVPTDAGMMSVALVQDSKGSWLVNDIQPGAQAVR